MAPEHVGHHLQNAIGVIHQLVDSLKATQTDLDKVKHECVTSATRISKTVRMIEMPSSVESTIVFNSQRTRGAQH